MDVSLNASKLVHKMSTGIIKYLIIHGCFYMCFIDVK